MLILSNKRNRFESLDYFEMYKIHQDFIWNHFYFLTLESVIIYHTNLSGYFYFLNIDKPRKMLAS